MATYTYSLNDVTLSVGPYIIKGKGAVRIINSVQKWNRSDPDGAGNETLFKNSAHKNKTIEIDVKRTSSDNAYLTLMYKAEESIIITVKDNFGNSLHVFPAAKIARDPDPEYAVDPGMNTWICLGQADITAENGN